MSDFPLAIITDEVSQDLKTIVRFAKNFDLSGIEIRSLYGKAFKDLTTDDVREIGKTLKGDGLKIAGCASPVFKCHLDRPEEITQHLEIFKHSVEKAMAWDCDLIRVFTFLRRSNPSTLEDLKEAASHFSKLQEAVKGTKIRIGIENEFTTLVGNGEETRDFMKMVEAPNIGVVWDPCNVVFMPGTGDPVSHDWPLIADRVIHVHVKDARRENGKPPEHCVELGTGIVDFPTQLRDLKKRGYRGWISMETHWRTKALSAEVQHLPAGNVFSADAEPASRICMKHLRDMLEKIE